MSTSSSSSVSYSSSSSSSSTSRSSYSSGSTSSSSSSSSIDSSSTSSESELNFSSSSSSSGVIWNVLKPFTYGHSAINGSGINNYIAQTISVENEIADGYVSVYKAYCYLYASQGSTSSLNINLDIYTCTSDAKPDIFVASNSVSGSTITEDGWYEFLYNTSPIPLTNNYLSFVLSQNSGDEDNYVLWGYVEDVELSTTKSFISNDGNNWEETDNTVYGLKVMKENRTLFDFEERRIVSESAKEKEFPTTLPLENEEFDDTKYEDGKVVIDNPKLLASFVVDSSGSMGWNDRFENRIDFANALVNHFSQYYDNDVLYDFVRFGSIEIDESGFDQQAETMKINLDAREPTRKTYVFTTTNPVNVVKNVVYAHNNFNYTVYKDASNVTSIVLTGTTDPLASGSLVKTIGSGDSPINFSSVKTINVDNSYFIACGFKNFRQNNISSPYSIAAVRVDEVDLIDCTSVSNWQLFYENGSHSITVANNGPESGTSLDVITSSYNSLNVRRPLTNRVLSVANISSNIASGDVIAEISNVSSFFVDQKIDFVDYNNMDFAHTVTSADNENNILGFTPAMREGVLNYNDSKGIVQESGLYNLYKFTGTTIMLLVKNALNYNNKITFYLQTTDGYMLEWDFYPLKIWYSYYFYWLSQTAKFNFTLKDKNGKYLEDGTQVNIEVGSKSGVDDSTTKYQKVSGSANIGDFIIYVDSFEGFEREQSISIVSKSNVQQTVIKEIGTNTNGSYIEVYDPLQFSLDLGNNPIISVTATSTPPLNDENQLAAVPLPMIDVTPIVTGKQLDPILLKPYDPPQIDPTTTYDEVNFDKVRIRNTVYELPTIDGKAVLRVLPITEDIIKTIKEKEDEAESLLTLRVTPSISSQNGLVELPTINAVSNVTSSVITEEDFTVETPVFSVNGKASSTMTSTATTFENKFFAGLSIPGLDTEQNTETGEYGQKIDSKEYDIYTSILARSLTGKALAKIYINEFKSYFAPQYYITSKGDGQGVYYWAANSCGATVTSTQSEIRPDFWDRAKFPGVHASSGKPYTIRYTVTDKFSLLKNGTLKIRIYSNQITPIENVAANLCPHEDLTELYSENYINVKSTDGSTSSIEKWRQAVAENKFSLILANQYGEGSGTALDNTLYFVNSFTEQNGSESESKAYQRAYGVKPPSSNYGPSCSEIIKMYQDQDIWTMAQQFSVFETEISVINGHASLTLPASNLSALILVEASYTFGNGLFESVRGDFVFYANPLNVEKISPETINADNPTAISEIGARITWMDDTLGYIDPNGVTASFEKTSSSTNLSPTVSIPQDGLLGGIFIGPRPVIYPATMLKDLYRILGEGSGSPAVSYSNAEPCSDQDSEIEAIDITVSSPTGYVYACTRTFKWLAIEKNQFIFSVTIEGDSTWADGGIESSTKLITDLSNNANKTIYGLLEDNTRYYVGEEGIEKLLGYLQPNNFPRQVMANGSVYANVPNEIKIKYGDDALFGTAWTIFGDDKKAVFYSKPNNQNIGFANADPGGCESDCQKCYFEMNSGAIPSFTTLPILKNVYMYTTYMDAQVMAEGVGTIYDDAYLSEAFSDWKSLQMEGGPYTSYTEPLNVSVLLEAYSKNFLRDGVHSPNIVAYISWKGESVKKNFTYNKGTSFESEINYPLPIVTFVAGECVQKNCVVGDLSGKWEYTPNAGDDYFTISNTSGGLQDPRAPFGDCIAIKNNENMKLTSYTVQSGFFRTDSFEHQIGDEYLQHTHETFVDDNGNGTTGEPIIIYGAVQSHTHTITNYVTDLQPEHSVMHSHKVWCVAITTLQPTTSVDTIAVNAYVPYDPTGAERGNFSDEFYPYPEGTNRLIYRSLYIKIDSSTKPKLKLEVYMKSNARSNSISSNVMGSNSTSVFFTAEKTSDTEKGFDIVFHAYFTSYKVEVSPGNFIVMPQKDVDDGTRIALNIKAYKPESSEDAVMIMDKNAPRSYLSLELVGQVSANDQFTEIAESTNITSNLIWMPGVEALYDEATSNLTTVTNSFSEINSLGSSQIYDAIRLAARRASYFKASNVITEDYKHVVFLLSDGDESLSEYSLNQAIQSVSSINGINQTPVNSIRLGTGYYADEVIMLQLAQKTNGNIYHCNNVEILDLYVIIKDILTGENTNINSGIYKVVFNIDKKSIPYDATLKNVTSPTDTEVYFRVRTSKDGATWSTWSSWQKDSNVMSPEKILNNSALYFEYEIKLVGNEYFESPSLSNGLSWNYYKPEETVIFFNPIPVDINNLEYVSSVQFTHRADLPETSTVEYGITQSSSQNIEDYKINCFTGDNRFLQSDKQEILLSRYNEPLKTNNYKTYLALNNRWPKYAAIEVYKYTDENKEGVLIDSSLYATNPEAGTITFSYRQNQKDKFMICIGVDSSFRVLCKIVNYGEKKASIDYIGLMYNVSKRIPTDTEGNIIHKTIGDRI